MTAATRVAWWLLAGAILTTGHRLLFRQSWRALGCEQWLAAGCSVIGGPVSSVVLGYFSFRIIGRWFQEQVAGFIDRWRF